MGRYAIRAYRSQSVSKVEKSVFWKVKIWTPFIKTVLHPCVYRRLQMHPTCLTNPLPQLGDSVKVIKKYYWNGHTIPVGSIGKVVYASSFRMRIKWDGIKNKRGKMLVTEEEWSPCLSDYISVV